MHAMQGICLKVVKLARVMVWAVAASDRSKSHLIFIEEGAKVNTQAYIKIFREKVLSLIIGSFGNRYVYTQDNAPSHISKMTQQWCNNYFRKFWNENMWLLASPDINPMNFAI